MMNDILREFLDKFVVVYLDDILLIYSKSEEEHLEHVRLVMEALKKAELYANPKKCKFLQKQIDFCGHIVGGGRIQMDRAKVQAILDWPQLRSVTDVRSFLGLCAYYNRFVKDFALIAAPLYELIKGSPEKTSRPVKMDFAAQLAFERLKKAMTGSTVVAQPDTSRPFIIETDASDFGYGAVILQVQPDGKEHPIAFLSKGFSPAERNYDTHERELLAIKQALRKRACYVENGFKTVVRTDHAGLSYLKTTTKPSGRLTRWLAEFGQFDLDIVYKPGPQNIVADALSRRSDYQVRTMEWGSDFDLALEAFVRDKKIPKDDEMAKELKKHEDHLRWNKDTERVEYQESSTSAYVPYLELWARSDTVNDRHRNLGHLGLSSMFKILRKRHWWPNMRQDIAGFVRACPECQLATKPRENRHRDQLHPLIEWTDRS
jgi:hypothetical protein